MIDLNQYEYRKACKQICADLHISPASVETEEEKYPNGSYSYVARAGSSICSFEFRFEFETESKRSHGKHRASLTIDHTPGTKEFYFDEKDEELQDVLDAGGSLSGWAALATRKYNIDYHPLNLDKKFRSMIIKVYGTPHYSDPTRDEVTYFLRGIQNTNIDNLLVCRIRHVSRPQCIRSYTYAFFVKGYRPLWVFFPYCGGLDSGAAGRDLRLIDSLIQDVGRKLTVKQESYDLDYEILEKFLVDKSESFEKTITDDSETLPELNSPSEQAFGPDFMNTFMKFKKHYESADFPEAMVILRKLVQVALEIACKRKGIRVQDMKDREKAIVNLSEILVGSEILKKPLMGWFLAFSQVANFSAHKDYPTEKHLNFYTKHRTLTAFLLGYQLILEIQALLLLDEPKSRSLWPD
jgi:hypothetical protein